MNGFHAFVSLLFTLSFLSVTACTPKPNSIDPIASGDSPKLFQTLAKSIQHLEISNQRDLPDSPWTLTLKLDSTWSIVMPGDRLGNDTYIKHFLSLLSSLEIKSSAIQAEPHTLGLAPPRFLFRGSSPQGLVELQIGNSIPDTQAFYGQYRLREKGPWIFAEFSGALLPLLGTIQSKNTFRESRLVTMDSVDIYSVEVFKNGTQQVKSERTSAGWTPNPGTIDKWLPALTHLRIKSFDIELPGLRAKWKPTWVFKLGNLSDEHLTIEISFYNNRWIGKSGARPESYFELFPETGDHLKSWF